MAVILARCQTCGPVRVDIRTAVLVFIPQGRLRRARYTFRCPGCEHVRLRTDLNATDTARLLDEGAGYVAAEPPEEFFDSVRTKPDPFSSAQVEILASTMHELTFLARTAEEE
jgi:hypothetical protein